MPSAPSQRAPAINQRPHDFYGDFEIFDQNPLGATRGSSRGQSSVTSIKAVPRMRSATMPSQLGNVVLPTITLSSRILDQLLEQSTSTLNFTIDSELIQLLFATDRDKVSQVSAQPITYVDTNLREGPYWRKPHTQVSPEQLTSNGRDKRQSLEHSVSTDASLQSTTKSHKATIVGRYRRRSGSGYIRGDPGSGLAKYGGSANRSVIHIKCVARVLNLNMFDEVRMALKSHSTDRQNRLIKNTFGRPLTASPRKTQSNHGKNSTPTLDPSLLESIWFVTFIGMLLIYGL